ncbi:1-phosphatidylinositol 4,5-bisphosphate phosphodiesterase delta-3-A [Zancudomyces culisetae]|uniref:Phosphoinositide phospholipase C n=1 Tax=Zancudomyces culisetae TaxID=1213189 RepID=A0A1R1PSD0_ZANCU|nr:1-phosphatidylinositol 4,5-bisphosphate phosphodiesterase delta-3-A [Zancudomyces culisetae]|eukprot:OMH83868.1 1-phosphatidylinositol 4,5-bisphosphate phosphodiesterase delta-3-A [Zancudomyces culisetae]
MILRTVLGSSLADKRMDFIEGMPSPNDLRYKILVKSKVINGGTESPIVFQRHKNPPLGPQQKSAVCGKIAKELSDLAVYLKGTTLTGITNSMIESGAIVSLSEYMAEDLCKSCTKHFIETNKSIFTRVYPAFSKITSVNYDPMQFWGVGVQMVALNFQTNDRFMMIHDAFFRQSLGTGYVLKPQTLRETTRISEKNATVSPKKECFSGSTTFIHHRTSFSSALKEQATNGSTFEEREVTDNSDKYVSIEFLSAEMGDFDFSSFFSDGLACGINVEYANTHPPQLVSDPFKLAALVRKYGNRNSSKDLLSGFSKHITTHSKRAIYLDFLRNGAKKLLTRPQRSREDETRENNENFYSTESYNTSVAGYTMYNRERLNHAIRKLSKSHPTKFGKISKKNPLKLLSFTSTDSVNPDITYRTKPSPIVTGYSYTFFQHEKVVLHHYDPTLTVVKFSLYLHQGHPRRPPSLSDAVKSRSRKPRFISFTENRHPICSGQNARSPPVATFSASQGVEIANFYLSLNDLKHGYRFLDLTPTQNLSNHLRPMNRTFASPSILVRISDFHSVKG